MRAPIPLPRPQWTSQMGLPLPPMAPVPLPRPAARLPITGASLAPQPKAPKKVKLSIQGHTVSVDESFLSLSKEQQNQTVDEIAAQMGIGPSSAKAEAPVMVRLPNGGSASFPANMPKAEIEAVLQRQFGGPASGQSSTPQLLRIEQALRAADSAGNVDDARRLASAYQMERLAEGIRRADAAGDTEAVKKLGVAYRQLQAQQSPDLARIKRNVAKMASMGAPEAEIDGYIQSEGVTVENVRNFRGDGTSGGKMATFEIKANGETYEVQAPDEASALRAFHTLTGQPMTPPVTLTGQVGKMDPAKGGVSRMLERDGRPVNPSGVVENISAGLNTAVNTMLGAPVDASRNLINWGIAGANALTGQKDLTTNMLRDDGFLSKKWWADTFKQFGVYDPNDVIAANAGEEIARLAGEGAGYAIAPEMALAGLARLGVVGPKATQIVQKLVGDGKSVPAMAGNALAGAGAGAGAGMAADAAPDEWKPLAATLGGLAGGFAGAGSAAIPGGVRAVGKMTGDYLAPLSQSGRERLVGQELRSGATSPGGVLDAINKGGPILSGSNPTTGQMTGDMGLLAMERAAAAKDPATFNQRRAEQNSARVGALEGVQRTGAPEQVAASVRQHIDKIQQQADEAIAAASGKARQANDRLGAGMTPEVVGTSLRESLEAARAQAKARERALWEAVDPDGSLSLTAKNTRQASAKIASEIPSSAKTPTGEEAAIFNVAKSYGDVVPFSELTALQSRLKTAMREERIANGESPAYRRLTQLNSALQNDLDGAIAQKVAQQQRAVAAGQMRPEETVEAALEALWTEKRESWLAGRRQEAVGGSFGSGPRAFAGGGSASISRDVGTAGQGPGGFDRPSGNPGVSPRPLPNFDADALSRLKSARAATKSREETFDNGTLAPIRKRPGTTSPYDMPASAVPSRIFFSGPKSFDAIRAYRQAVGDPAALESLMRYALGRLRTSALRDDGTLDPAKLANFRRTHADALRAFPQLDEAFASAGRASEAMASVAAAQRQALDEAQRGLLARFIGLSDPGDVSRTVGSIFNRADAAAQMFRLRVALGSNAEAKEGLRKAVVDFMLEKFVGNTEAGTTGLGLMKTDAFQTFVSRNKPALRSAGFTDSEIGVFSDIARDLQQSNRSLTAARLPGGSNTAQDLLAAKAGDSKGQSILKALMIGASSVPGFVVGGGFGAVAAPVVSAIVSTLRQNGITKMDELLKLALLDPQLARSLMVKATPANAKFVGPSIRQRLARSLAASEMAQDEKQPASQGRAAR